MTDITYRMEGDYLISELILLGEGYEGCLKSGYAASRPFV